MPGIMQNSGFAHGPEEVRFDHLLSRKRFGFWIDLGKRCNLLYLRGAAVLRCESHNAVAPRSYGFSQQKMCQVRTDQYRELLNQVFRLPGTTKHFERQSMKSSVGNNHYSPIAIQQVRH